MNGLIDIPWKIDNISFSDDCSWSIISTLIQQVIPKLVLVVVPGKIVPLTVSKIVPSSTRKSAKLISCFTKSFLHVVQKNYSMKKENIQNRIQKILQG